MNNVGGAGGLTFIVLKLIKGRQTSGIKQNKRFIRDTDKRNIGKKEGVIVNFMHQF